MARTFDGSNDQIAYGSDAAADDLSAFTAVALVRITGNVVDERQIFTKMTAGYTGKIYISASGDGVNNNKVFGVVVGSVDGYGESAVNALVVNTWRVIVSTWAGSLNPVKLYACDLGGSIAELSYTSQTSNTGSISADASATLRLGARDAADATFFAGGLAECALWNRVLSLGEISALGRGYSPRFFPNGRVFYSPVDGRSSPEFNYGGTSGTVTEAAYLEHPKVVYPSTRVWSSKGATAAAFNAPWAASANVVLGTGQR